MRDARRRARRIRGRACAPTASAMPCCSAWAAVRSRRRCCARASPIARATGSRVARARHDGSGDDRARSSSRSIRRGRCSSSRRSRARRSRPTALFAYFHELVARREGRARRRELRRHHRCRHAAAKRWRAQHNFRHVFTNPARHRRTLLRALVLWPRAGRGRRRRRRAAARSRHRRAAEAARAAASDALRLGAALGELALAGRDKCTFVVSPRIASFGLWVEQLIAESTGKDRARASCPSPASRSARRDQYGDDRVFVQLRARRTTRNARAGRADRRACSRRASR